MAGFFLIIGNRLVAPFGDSGASATGDGFLLCITDGLRELATELRDELRE